MTPLKKDRLGDRHFKKFVPDPAIVETIKKSCIAEYVRNNACAIVTIYCFCKLLNLSQEEFEVARTTQIARLRNSLEIIRQAYEWEPKL